MCNPAYHRHHHGRMLPCTPWGRCTKLGELHADAPAHTPEATVAAIERAFCRPVTALFAELEVYHPGDSPLASTMTHAQTRNSPLEN